MEIKNLIILLLIFIIIIWLQNNDDKKFNKVKRKSLYDIIKLPLFVLLIILIIKDFNCKIYDNFKSLIIFTSTSSIINDSNFDHDIFIDPPDF